MDAPRWTRLLIVLLASVVMSAACGGDDGDSDATADPTDAEPADVDSEDAESESADPEDAESEDADPEDAELEDAELEDAELEDGEPEESEPEESDEAGAADGVDGADAEENVEDSQATDDGGADTGESLSDDPVPTGPGCGAAVTPGQSTVSFVFEGRERVYELFVPDSYDAETPIPLVLNWHGLGSSGPEQIGFSEYAVTAGEEGFLLVAPTGVPSPGDTRNSWELLDEIDPSRDDMAFAANVLDRVIATTCVDEARVYTTGMSNGGYFTSRLVCELGDRIAAAASVAGLAHPDDCDPARAVPYIAFHGVNDDVVPYEGGGFSSLAPGERIDLFELVIPDEFAEFAAANGCDPEPVEEAVTDLVTSFTYQNCSDGSAAVFYRLDGAGHTWPGSLTSSAISVAAGLGVTNTDVNATQLSWEFFERHSLS